MEMEDISFILEVEQLRHWTEILSIFQIPDVPVWNLMFELLNKEFVP